jgi:hypothetical protein
VSAPAAFRARSSATFAGPGVSPSPSTKANEDATRWRRAAPHLWRPIAWTTCRRLDQWHVDLDYPVTNEETELAADVIGAQLLGAKTQR